MIGRGKQCACCFVLYEDYFEFNSGGGQLYFLSVFEQPRKGRGKRGASSADLGKIEIAYVLDCAT